MGRKKNRTMEQPESGRGLIGGNEMMLEDLITLLLGT